jgi:hypothetical protein
MHGATIKINITLQLVLVLAINMMDACNITKTTTTLIQIATSNTQHNGLRITRQAAVIGPMPVMMKYKTGFDHWTDPQCCAA